MSRPSHRIRSTLLGVLLLAAPAAPRASGAQAPPRASASRVPLCPGTTIVTAVSQPEGDYESIKTVETVDDRALGLRYSSERRVNGALQKVTVRRRILVKDLVDATLYLHHFDRRAPVTVPGTTAIGTSAAVLRALKGTGEARLGLFDAVAGATPANAAVHPNIYDYEMVESVHRVGTGTVAVPVIVNDESVTLPAIRARGDFMGDQAEFLFLDDEANPMALRYRIGRDALDVVKISYRCAEARGSDGRRIRSRLEQALLATGRVDVYSIYFSFNSDELRPESDSTLRELGDVLRRHPDWKLAIGGHTDGIGGDAYNLDLSRRRAEAVKRALVARERIDASRLTTAGYGKRNPKDTNATLEGRARNRRVELVRTS